METTNDDLEWARALLRWTLANVAALIEADAAEVAQRLRAWR